MANNSESRERQSSKSGENKTQMKGVQNSREGSGVNGPGSSVGLPNQTRGKSSNFQDHAHAGSTGFGSAAIAPQTQGEPSVGKGTHRPADQADEK